MAEFGHRRAFSAAQPVPPAPVALPWWRTALLGLAILAGLEVAGWYVIQANQDFVGASLNAPIGLGGYVAARTVQAVVKFLLFALALWGMVRLLGGAARFWAVSAAFLLIPAAGLVVKLLELAGVRFATFVEQVRLDREAAVLNALARGAMWLVSTPHSMTVLLVALAVLAARIGGRIGWPQAVAAGLVVAGLSFGVEFLFFSTVFQSETAIRIASGQILRLG